MNIAHLFQFTAIAATLGVLANVYWFRAPDDRDADLCRRFLVLQILSAEIFVTGSLMSAWLVGRRTICVEAVVLAVMVAIAVFVATEARKQQEQQGDEL